MLYQEFQVCAELQPFIQCYWKFLGPTDLDVPSTQHYILPDACPSLIFYAVPKYKVWGSALFGPTKYITEKEIFCDSITIGIRFKPGFTLSIFQQKGWDLRNQNIIPAPALPNLEPQPIFDLMAKGEEVIDYFNRELPKIFAACVPRNHPIVETAINQILQSKGNVKIAELLKHIPLSERQLQKTFKEEVGLTLKEFATTMRLRAAIIQMELEKKGYQDTVFNSGYYDQAHFIRDFSKLSKISLPNFRKYIKNINHIGVSFRE